MLTGNDKAFLVCQEPTIIKNKGHILCHIGIDYFWLRKFLQISAVPQVIWGITLIRPILDFVPKLVKMRFYSRIIFNPYPRNSPFPSVMSIDEPKIGPLITIPLDIPAAKNRSYKFLRPFAFIFCLAIRKDFISLFS